MTLSDSTYRRLKDLADRVKDIMHDFNCSEERAWQMLNTNEAEKVLEVARRLDGARGSGWKVVRNVASKLVGDIDTFVK